jgi:hypothetical protein
MHVADAVGKALAGLGVDAAFGVIGSGNFAVTNALRDAGVDFVHARHECAAVSMADAYARVTGRVGVATVHQGPGLTNALTGLTEAAKARTPLLLLAADTSAGAVRSNFRIDQAALASAVGGVAERLHSPQTALADLARAYRRAVAIVPRYAKAHAHMGNAFAVLNRPDEANQLHAMVNPRQHWAGTVHIYLTPITEFFIYHRGSDGRFQRERRQLWFDGDNAWRSWKSGAVTGTSVPERS